MAPDDFSPADLDDLAAQLRAVAGVRSVDLDPAKVRTPGIWVRFDGLTFEQLGALTINTTLHLVVGESDRARATEALAGLLNQVKPTVRRLGGPSAQVTPVGLVLPGSQTPLPALAVPLDLITDQE